MKEVKYLKLKEIATEMYRGSGIKKDQVVSEGYPCVRYGEIYTTYDIAFDKCVSHTTESEISARKYFEKGDILFAITGESVEDIGKSIAYLGDEKCLLGGDIVAMKHNQNPKYLAYALSSPSAIKQKGIGKTKLKVVHTNIPSLKEIVIPIPSPEEQAAIVSKLDTAFAKIDKIIANAADALNEAQDYFATSLCDSFVPKEEWLTASVDKLALDVKYGTSKPSHADGDYIYLRMNNISNDGHLVLKDLKYISLPEKELEKCIVRKGDILFNRTNSYEHVGKTCVFNNDTPMVIAGYIIRVRLNDKIIPEFFSYFMNSACTKQVLRGLSVGAVHQSNISAKSLKKVNVFFPESIAEQRKIVESIQQQELKIKSLKENYDKIVSECMAMKQALLKEVFGD